MTVHSSHPEREAQTADASRHRVERGLEEGAIDRVLLKPSPDVWNDLEGIGGVDTPDSDNGTSTLCPDSLFLHRGDLPYFSSPFSPPWQSPTPKSFWLQTFPPCFPLTGSNQPCHSCSLHRCFPRCSQETQMSWCSGNNVSTDLEFTLTWVWILLCLRRVAAGELIGRLGLYIISCTSGLFSG